MDKEMSIKESVEKALQDPTGAYLVVVVRYLDGTLYLDRVCNQFPFNQMMPAVEVIKEDLAKEMSLNKLKIAPKSSKASSVGESNVV